MVSSERNIDNIICVNKTDTADILYLSHIPNAERYYNDKIYQQKNVLNI